MYWFRLWVVACTVVLQRSRMLCRCVEPKELAVADTILELLISLELLVPFVGFRTCAVNCMVGCVLVPFVGPCVYGSLAAVPFVGYVLVPFVGFLRL